MRETRGPHLARVHATGIAIDGENAHGPPTDQDCLVMFARSSCSGNEYDRAMLAMTIAGKQKSSGTTVLIATPTVAGLKCLTIPRQILELL